MKNAALVVAVALLALAVGFYAGTARAASPASGEGQGRWLPQGDGSFITSTVDAKGIIVWTIKGGAAAQARSFWVEDRRGADGSWQHVVQEDPNTYRAAN